jgi:hypothetical protein
VHAPTLGAKTGREQAQQNGRVRPVCSIALLMRMSSDSGISMPSALAGLEINDELDLDCLLRRETVGISLCVDLGG